MLFRIPALLLYCFTVLTLQLLFGRSAWCTGDNSVWGNAFVVTERVENYENLVTCYLLTLKILDSRLSLGHTLAFFSRIIESILYLEICPWSGIRNHSQRFLFLLWKFATLCGGGSPSRLLLALVSGYVNVFFLVSLTKILFLNNPCVYSYPGKNNIVDDRRLSYKFPSHIQKKEGKDWMVQYWAKIEDVCDVVCPPESGDECTPEGETRFPVIRELRKATAMSFCTTSQIGNWLLYCTKRMNLCEERNSTK